MQRSTGKHGRLPSLKMNKIKGFILKTILILLCVFMPIVVIAKVYIDPYGYWYTELTVQERYELDLLLVKYYSNYLDEPGKPMLRQRNFLVHSDCYNNQSLASRELQQP